MSYLKRGYQGVKITDYLLKTRTEVHDGETVELYKVIDNEGNSSYKSQKEIDEENERIKKINEGKSKDDPSLISSLKKIVEKSEAGEKSLIKLGKDVEIEEGELINVLDDLNGRGYSKGSSPSTSAESAAKPDISQWKSGYTLENYLKDAENAISDLIRSKNMSPNTVIIKKFLQSVIDQEKINKENPDELPNKLLYGNLSVRENFLTYYVDLTKFFITQLRKYGPRFRLYYPEYMSDPEYNRMRNEDLKAMNLSDDNFLAYAMSYFNAGLKRISEDVRAEQIANKKPKDRTDDEKKELLSIRERQLKDKVAAEDKEVQKRMKLEDSKIFYTNKIEGVKSQITDAKFKMYDPESTPEERIEALDEKRKLESELSKLEGELSDIDSKLQKSKKNVSNRWSDLKNSTEKFSNDMTKWTAIAWAAVALVQNVANAMPGFFEDLINGLFGIDKMTTEEKNRSAHSSSDKKSLIDEMGFDADDKYLSRRNAEISLGKKLNKVSIFDLTPGDLDDLKNQGVDLSFYDNYMNLGIKKKSTYFNEEHLPKDKTQADIIRKRIILRSDLLDANNFSSGYAFDKNATDDLAEYNQKYKLGEAYGAKFKKYMFYQGRIVDRSTRKESEGNVTYKEASGFINPSKSNASLITRNSSEIDAIIKSSSNNPDVIDYGIMEVVDDDGNKVYRRYARLGDRVVQKEYKDLPNDNTNDLKSVNDWEDATIDEQHFDDAMNELQYQSDKGVELLQGNTTYKTIPVTSNKYFFSTNILPAAHQEYNH